MARINFNQIFNTNTDGSIESRQRIRVGGIELGPGVRFGNGVSFGGIDFSQFIGNDFEVDIDGNLVIIKGIYNR